MVSFFLEFSVCELCEVREGTVDIDVDVKTAPRRGVLSFFLSGNRLLLQESYLLHYKSYFLLE